MEARISACFVVVAASDPGRIVGYYTLSQTYVSAEKLPEALRKKLPRYSELGATLIGRLARDISWKGKEIGRLLLVDALRRCERISTDAGAVVVVTDPKGEKARAFYQDYGFLPLDERRLFIPMKELVERNARGWKA